MSTQITQTIPTRTAQHTVAAHAVRTQQLGGLLVAIAAAAAVGGAAANGAALPPAAGALDPVQALIGDARCLDDSECRTLPVGSKPCGGPQSFVAWSVQRSNLDSLQRAIAAQQSAKDAAAPADRMSTCSVVTDPGAYCHREGAAAAAAAAAAGQCRLRPRGSRQALPQR